MSSLPIRVLLIEDNPGDARLLQEMLDAPGSLKAELTHLGSMNDALSHLERNTANIILLDLGLPDAEGLEAVRKVHAAAPSTPLVVLTGLDDELLATQALQEGAQDYLIKGQIESHALLRAVRYAIERQRMQVETDQVRRLQLQLKDEFLSHVSHELRSPLTAIYQFGTILADELAGGVTSDQRECLQIILRNVGQLQSMIGDLLEVTRAQEGKLSIDPQCTSVPDAITYTVKTLQGPARSKGIILTFDSPPPLPLAYADPTRVRQILIILLDNAVKFTDPNGTVTVRAQLFMKDPSFLLMEVTDSGCGISADMTERIFERLCQVGNPSQGGRKGLGLGLYICKELVTRQGGYIWVTSSPQGSIFSFTLPVFSLAHLLSPLIKNEQWPADSVALLSVEIRSPDGWLSKEIRDEWSRDTRGLLQRCLLPDLDVLLPKTGSGGAGEVFQIVAFADEKGVAVLTKRIREQFQRLKHCKESGLTFSTSFRLLERAPLGLHAPVEEVANAMAVRIEDLIKSDNLARMGPIMSNKKILIVDDDRDVRLGYHIRLKANNYETFFAADSLTSIVEARKHRPDLIILDLGLPGGDGFVVMERLKANMYLAVIPVIVVTARDPYPDRERALKAGAKAVLQKPVNNDELLAIIQHCLGENNGSEQQRA